MLREVRFLRAGHCLVDRAQLITGEAAGHLIRIPIWAFLLRSDDALILVDSGMPEDCIGNEGYFAGSEDADQIRPLMGEADGVLRILERQAVAPEDLDLVVLTHSHFDHAGGSSRLRTQQVLMHGAELEAVRQEDVPPRWLDMSLSYRGVDDGFEPTEGVRLIHTPGHTPGHLSIHLRLPDRRPILLTADAVYMRENWERGVPGAMSDPEAGRRSVDRLREIARMEKADVFFGHDPVQAQEPDWLSFVRE